MATATLTGSQPLKRVGVVAGLLGVAASCFLLTSILNVNARPLAVMQMVLSVLLLACALLLDHRTNTHLPVLLRPRVAVASSTVAASLAATLLGPDNHREYMALWLAMISGVAIGMVPFRGPKLLVPSASPRTLNETSVLNLAKMVLVISYGAALFFFAWQGIPAIGSDIEQGRVDAAAGGTGYVRLLAYMSIPAVLALFALRHRLAVPALVLSTLVILGLANRSPLLYLYVPILVILGSQGRVRLTTAKVIGAATIAAVVVGGIGAMRIASQEQFAQYAEYRNDLASGNIFGVGVTSLTQYAKVITENAVLTKSLVDNGAIPHQYGASYFTLFISSLPGEQLSLDRTIKLASGRSFIGGGTPPTLMGEAYVNFGYVGSAAIGISVVLLLRYWAAVNRREIEQHSSPCARHLDAAVYGYMLCWVVGSPVAGLAGASTVPLAGAILLVVIRALSRPRL